MIDLAFAIVFLGWYFRHQLLEFQQMCQNRNESKFHGNHHRPR